MWKIWPFDTMIAEWLIDPASRNLGLKEMAEHYLGAQMTHIEELIGKGKGQISMADVPIAQAAPYAAADAEVTLRLHPILEKRLADAGEHLAPVLRIGNAPCPCSGRDGMAGHLA